MKNNSTNVDPHEIAKFDALAARWWDKAGEFKPLHDLNPLRLRFIEQHSALAGLKVLDVGCGGGILSEALAEKYADVLGIDLARQPLEIAKLHALETEVSVEYQCVAIEQLAEQQPQSFDVLTCMEMLEHVPEPDKIIQAAATLVKPGGKLFFSTINRNPKAFLFAILGAEYLLNLLPKGTHEYQKFIKPSELTRWARNAGLSMVDMQGIVYSPLTKNFKLSKTDVDVNYLMCFQRVNQNNS